MAVVILLLLIPIFSIGIVLYFTNIFEFITTGNFNEVLFIISTALTVVSSYLIPDKFVNLFKTNKIKTLNKKNIISSFSSYFSVIILFVLGVALLYRGILNNNMLQIFTGIGLSLIFIYCTYMFYFCYEDNEFILVNIGKINNIYELQFENDKLVLNYYTNLDEYKETQRYILKYNKYTRCIKKINGMVLGGDIREKDNKEKYKKKK